MGLRLIDSAHIVYSLIGLGICFALLWRGCSVEAQGAWPVWTEEDKLLLGRAIMLESDFNNEREAAAIGHVLVKRWKQHKQRKIAQTITSYCAGWDTRSTRYYRLRTRNIRDSTWENVLHGTSKQWGSLRLFVESFTQKRIKDPCPAATHFAGRTDRIPPTWVCVCKFAPRGNVFCHPMKD